MFRYKTYCRQNKCQHADTYYVKPIRFIFYVISGSHWNDKANILFLNYTDKNGEGFKISFRTMHSENTQSGTALA